MKINQLFANLFNDGWQLSWTRDLAARINQSDFLVTDGRIYLKIMRALSISFSWLFYSLKSLIARPNC